MNDLGRGLLTTILLCGACSSSLGDGADDVGDDVEADAGDDGLALCDAGEVVDQKTSACVTAAPGPGDLVGEITLLQQTNLAPTDFAFANPAKAEASFWRFEERPTDDRKSFMTAEGERCAFDVGEQWPGLVDGASWPAGPILSVGDVTFVVDGAPGPIFLDEATIGASATYYHRNDPPPIKSGATTYGDFFPAYYAAAGAGFHATNEGGDDLDGHTWNGRGEMQWSAAIPQTPLVLQPALETNGDVSIKDGLELRWHGGGEPGMRIELALSIVPEHGDSVMMRCDLEDDGEVVLPAAELTPFTTMPAAFYLSRQRAQTMMLEIPDGRAFITVKGRNDRFRVVELAP